MLLTLEEYELIAKKSLLKRGIVINDEILGEAIHSIILADIRHTGTNLQGFRSSYIDFMIKTLSTKRRKSKEVPMSTNIDEKSVKDSFDSEFWEFIQAKLPKNKYEMIYDRYKNGLSIKEIALKNKLSEKWVYSLISDSIKSLNKYKELLC